MELYASCMCCLLGKQEKEIRKYADEEKKRQYMKELMLLVGNSGQEANAPWLASQIMKVHEKYFGKSESLRGQKVKYNRLVLEMQEELEGKIRAHKDPLCAALRYARVGNHIDFSALEEVNPEEFAALFEREEDQIDGEVYAKFCDELTRAHHMVYITDNCGEIVLDKLVIRILKERFPKLQITAMVRGAEVVNDATMEDALETGLAGEVTVVPNGDDVAGTILSRISGEALALINQADIVLAKGQGNFESLNGCGKNIYYLFLCKCDWFMRKFQVERFHGMFICEENKTSGRPLK
jgi:uncharacterized protein with ATP-grasp and redox domains